MSATKVTTQPVHPPTDRAPRPASRSTKKKAVSADRQTWKDMAWLALTSLAGFTLGLAAITAAGIVLA